MLQQLQAQLDALVAKRSRFEVETRALSEGQLRFRPAEGSWSIAEVAQHILHVEREVMKAASRPDVARHGHARNFREWMGLGVFLAIVLCGVRIKVPPKVAGLVTPAANPDIEILWSEWAQMHRTIERYMERVREENLREMAFRHPIIGPTSVRGLLPFLAKHFDHHMRQVGRIRRSAGFPAA